MQKDLRERERLMSPVDKKLESDNEEMYDLNAELEEGEVGTGEGKKEQDEEELSRKLASVTEKTEEITKLAKVLADPDVRALLALKEEGKAVVVSEKVEKEAPKLKLDGVKDETADAFVGYLTTLLDPLKQKVAEVSQYIQEQEGGKAKEEVQKAREKFSDFDEFRETMIEINKANPGLSAEELYFVAKRRKKGGAETVKTDSERPRTLSTRPALREKKPVAPGRAGFSTLLSEVLDSLEI